MIFKVEKRDLFTVGDEYYLAHCISSDCAMSAGIAVEFQKRFHLRNKLLNHLEVDREHPTCLKVGRVFNLITKKKYYDKPSHKCLILSLIEMKKQMLEQGITKLAMPRIACGLDGLYWEIVEESIEEIFKNTDIEILICYL